MYENERYKQLFSELEKYENAGVHIGIDGNPASPQQIVNAHLLKEEGAYMRDYTINPEGKIEKIEFTTLKKHLANRTPSR